MAGWRCGHVGILIKTFQKRYSAITSPRFVFDMGKRVSNNATGDLRVSLFLCVGFGSGSGSGLIVLEPLASRCVEVVNKYDLEMRCRQDLSPLANFQLSF